MHKSVLLHESIDALDLSKGETFLDGTFGGGGHVKEVLKRLGTEVRIIALDQDPEAEKRAEGLGIEFRQENFRNLDKALSDLGVEQVDAILLDIGLSSDQLEVSGRGFSFRSDEPLDMRMSSVGPTAADILNSWDEHAIELILRGFGEERYSKRIAAEIVRRREIHPLKTTFDLVEAVEAARPKSWKEKIHPATKTFQAVRIAVNEELTALEEGLHKGFEALAPDGRLAVISFHSLEDRIVKNFFRDQAKEERAKLITKKPITPTEEETEENPRSRSAKLRILRKIQ